MNNLRLSRFFRRNDIHASIHYYAAENRTIRYIATGNGRLPALLFIHGAPASLTIYKDYYREQSLLKTFTIYGVDRPGYGGSGRGKPEPSIEKQSRMLIPLLNTIKKAHRPVILVGGSYGASIACRILMDQPHIADGAVLIAPPLAPGQEKMYWMVPVMENPLLKWMLPGEKRSSNTEKRYHKEELKKMLPYWKNICVPVAYLQGEKDDLVYTSNADFARKQLVNVPWLEINFIKGQKHDVSTKEVPAVRNKVLECYSMLQKQIPV